MRLVLYFYTTQALTGVVEARNIIVSGVGVGVSLTSVIS